MPDFPRVSILIAVCYCGLCIEASNDSCVDGPVRDDNNFNRSSESGHDCCSCGRSIFCPFWRISRAELWRDRRSRSGGALREFVVPWVSVLRLAKDRNPHGYVSESLGFHEQTTPGKWCGVRLIFNFSPLHRSRETHCFQTLGEIGSVLSHGALDFGIGGLDTESAVTNRYEA